MSYTDRREFLRAIVTGAVGLSVTYRPAFGQGTPPAITATKLSPTLALLSGNGGNVAIVIGSDGLMMVDGGLPDRAADMLKAVTDQVGPQRIRAVFNTHWHFDHIGLNETLGRAGAKIIAHENTKKWLGMRVTMEALGRTFEPLKPEGLPAETFNKSGSLMFEKEKIEYTPVAPAHTDGDSYVVLRGPNVLHTGDLLFKDTYPVIDYSTGGWIGGMAAACGAMYKACDANTRVIPGHGSLASRDDLKASQDMLVTVQDRLAPLVKQGKTADEAVASKPTKDLDGKWGKGFMTPDNFVRAAYVSLQRRTQKG